MNWFTSIYAWHLPLGWQHKGWQAGTERKDRTRKRKQKAKAKVHTWCQGSILIHSWWFHIIKQCVTVTVITCGSSTCSYNTIIFLHFYVNTEFYRHPQSIVCLILSLGLTCKDSLLESFTRRLKSQICNRRLFCFLPPVLEAAQPVSTRFASNPTKWLILSEPRNGRFRLCVSHHNEMQKYLQSDIIKYLKAYFYQHSLSLYHLMSNLCIKKVSYNSLGVMLKTVTILQMT